MSWFYQQISRIGSALACDAERANSTGALETSRRYGRHSLGNDEADPSRSASVYIVLFSISGFTHEPFWWS